MAVLAAAGELKRIKNCLSFVFNWKWRPLGFRRLARSRKAGRMRSVSRDARARGGLSRLGGVSVGYGTSASTDQRI